MGIKSRSIGQEKHPYQNQEHLKAQNQSECNYCGAKPSHPRDKCSAILLKYVCRKCGKEGHVARKCRSKTQSVNSLDESVSDCGKEVYQLFTLDIHSVRAVSVKKGKKFFATIKLAATDDFFVCKTLQLDTASTTNTLAVDYLTSMCPVGFGVNALSCHLKLFFAPMEEV